MAIITQPPRTFLSAYRPIQFEVLTTGATTFIPQNAVVDLYVNGDFVSQFRVKSTGFAPSITPGINEYTFCIDVAERMRDLIAPFSSLPSVFVMDCPTAPVNNTDSVAAFFLRISYEALDTNTGLIVTSPVPSDQTNEFFASNITRQDLENMYLTEFTTNVPESRALTNSETGLKVCRDENIFLSYAVDPVTDPPTAFRVVLYDSLGAIIGEAIGALNTTAFVGSIFTFNTGIENGLKCLTFTTTSIAFDLDDPNISSYTVDIGLSILGLYFPLRETFTYNLRTACKCCDKRKFRLHWLNLLGGVDSHTFCSIKELKYKTKAVTAEKALPWDKTSLTPHNPTDSSSFKTRTTNELIYRIVSENISNSEAVWLSEMLGSVKVYFEVEPNLLIPVIIQDTEQIISKETGKRNLELTIKLSSCIITQTV